MPATLKDLGRLMPACAGVRRWGAASLDLAYVAAGWRDGYVENFMNAWDCLAAIALIRSGAAVESAGVDFLPSALGAGA